MGENSKSWWETLGGIMTGIAALITAVTGLMVALYTFGEPESRSRNSVITAPIEASALPETRQTAEKARGSRGESRTSVAARPAHTIALPENAEYVLGPKGRQARYELQSAVVWHSTTEADVLRIHVRFANLSENPNSRMHFQSSAFRLAIDERKLSPSENFNYTVFAQKTREADVLFLISKEVKHATLKIGGNTDGVDVPLDLGRGT